MTTVSASGAATALAAAASSPRLKRLPSASAPADTTRRHSERNGQAIPGVDNDDREGQRHDLVLVEQCRHPREQPVRYMRVDDPRHRLGLFERGPLAVGEERRLVPGLTA